MTAKALRGAGGNLKISANDVFPLTVSGQRCDSGPDRGICAAITKIQVDEPLADAPEKARCLVVDRAQTKIEGLSYWARPQIWAKRRVIARPVICDGSGMASQPGNFKAAILERTGTSRVVGRLTEIGGRDG